MPSVRKTALDALFTLISGSLATSDRVIVRNAEEPTKVPSNGFLILRDGESGEPESVTLSPLRYAYEHIAELTVIVQDREADERDTDIDNILIALDAAIVGDRTLGGVVDFTECRSPDVYTDIEDGKLHKVAIIPIMVRFVTNNPLS